MEEMPRGAKGVVIAIIVVFGLVPVGLYWFFLASVPTVSAAEGRSMVASGEAVLADIRAAKEYECSHVPEAVNWPYPEALSVKSGSDVPPAFAGRRLLVMCGGGVGGAFAVRHLADRGIDDVYHVRGGMDDWIASASRRCVIGGMFRKATPEDRKDPFFRESSLARQFVAVVSGFVIKPAYMLGALALAFVLRRRREEDLVALRWGLMFFFIGEAFCAANYAVFEDGSYLFEYLHGYPMALAFGFTTFAFFEGLDSRVIKYSDPAAKCAALGLCRACIKYEDVPCGLKRLFLVIVPASLVLAFMPLCGRIVSGSYNTSIFGTLYNYSHPAVYQIFEMYYCPRVAIFLFWMSFMALVLLGKSAVSWSKVLFAAGTGALGFAMLRWVFFSSYRDDFLWATFWEEVTELLYVAGVAYTLWVFRAGIFRKASEPSAATQDPVSP